MLKNYFKIAWRNFLRNKSYSLINVLGLAIGLGCLILIMLFVADELSYDKFHDDREQIHFVATESEFGGSLHKGLSTPYPLGPAMKEEIPEVEHSVITIQWAGSGRVSTDGEEFATEDLIMMATDDFFKVFSFPLIMGDPETVLTSPSSVILTEEMAYKYFGDENPLGKTLTIERYGNEEYTVTGIAENMQYNSYLNFDFVTSIQNNSSVLSNRDSWGARMFHTYVKLHKGASWEQVKSKLAELTNRKLGEGSQTTFFSIPVTGLYISDLVTRDGFKSSMKYVYIFSAIALFILLLACINYMNLATARGVRRSREVGIRKVVGANKKQLVFQFIGEAVIVAFFAFFIGLLFAEVLLPYFNNFIGGELSLDLANNGTFIFSLFVISILVGIASGSYPAFFLSRFKPSTVLKGESATLLTGTGLRKTLVVIQFAVSTVLIISTLIAFNQLQYVMERDLGFRGEQVLVIPAYQIQDRIETFKQTALSHSAVINASAASGTPGDFWLRVSQAFDPQNPDHTFAVHLVRTDADYRDVLDLELIAGRYFDEEHPTDRDNTRVINESMLAELGWGSPEEAIGRTFHDGSELIGVIKDFHFQTLHSQIGPVYLQMKPTNAPRYDGYNRLAVRFHPEQISSLIDYLQEEWNKLAPSHPIIYHFLDEKFVEQYETDQKLSWAFSTFAGIAIFIACLGLFGLAAFSAERRTKEIGIRKVMGATVANIVTLLSKDFVKLVVIGFMIAIPIAWYAMNQWLADFAYKIHIGAGIFVLAGGAALVIALLTVSWQSVKAALANPAKSLRTE